MLAAYSWHLVMVQCDKFFLTLLLVLLICLLSAENFFFTPLQKQNILINPVNPGIYRAGAVMVDQILFLGLKLTDRNAGCLLVKLADSGAVGDNRIVCNTFFSQIRLKLFQFFFL